MLRDCWNMYRFRLFSRYLHKASYMYLCRMYKVKLRKSAPICRRIRFRERTNFPRLLAWLHLVLFSFSVLPVTVLALPFAFMVLLLLLLLLNFPMLASRGISVVVGLVLIGAGGATGLLRVLITGGRTSNVGLHMASAGLVWRPTFLGHMATILAPIGPDEENGMAELDFCGSTQNHRPLRNTVKGSSNYTMNSTVTMQCEMVLRYSSTVMFHVV